MISAGVKRKSSTKTTQPRVSVAMCSTCTVTTALMMVLCSAMHAPTSTAFLAPQHSIVASRSPLPRMIPHSSSSVSSFSSTTSTTARFMSWEEVSDFYQNFPIQSAVLTCGFKASIADGIAQLKAMKDKAAVVDLELQRNLAYVLYGGIFVGIMCHVEYNEVFPLLFGTEEPHVLEKVFVDDFISAPLMWLPPAYFIKAWIYDYSMKEGLQKYIHDIRHNGLLFKYWSVWVPAQTVSFSCVPDHMRVAFMACISFFWFIIFSTVASKSDNDTIVATVAADVSKEQIPTIPQEQPL